MTQSLSYIKPGTYDVQNSLPPIIDIAQSYANGSQDGLEEVKADGGPPSGQGLANGTGEFSRNFKQWDVQR